LAGKAVKYGYLTGLPQIRYVPDVNDTATNRVEEFRRGKRWNQESLAYHAGVSVRTVSNIENGLRRPVPSTKKAIADALGVPVQIVFPDLFPTEEKVS
jgi:transcriptional regulator with XRE-family HTH domain